MVLCSETIGKRLALCNVLVLLELGKQNPDRSINFPSIVSVYDHCLGAHGARVTNFFITHHIDESSTDVLFVGKWQVVENPFSDLSAVGVRDFEAFP